MTAAVLTAVLVFVVPWLIVWAYVAGVRYEARRHTGRDWRQTEREDLERQREFDAAMGRINRNIGRAEGQRGMNSDRWQR